MEPIAKYLDIEDEQKRDLSVRAPSNYVHKDVCDFKIVFEKIKASNEQQEKNFIDKDLIKILEKVPELVSY